MQGDAINGKSTLIRPITALTIQCAKKVTVQ